MLQTFLVWVAGTLVGIVLGIVVSVYIWPLKESAPGANLKLSPSRDAERFAQTQRLYERAVRGDVTALHLLGGRAGIVAVTGYGDDGAPWHTDAARNYAAERYRLAREAMAANGDLTPPVHGWLPGNCRTCNASLDGSSASSPKWCRRCSPDGSPPLFVMEDATGFVDERTPPPARYAGDTQPILGPGF